MDGSESVDGVEEECDVHKQLSIRGVGASDGLEEAGEVEAAENDARKHGDGEVGASDVILIIRSDPG